MKVVFKGGKTPVSVERLEAVEKKLGIQFPDDYRAFFLKYNGGSPEPSMFEFTGVDGYKNSSIVSKFFAIYDGIDDNFELEYLYYRENERIPDNVAPIAYDPAGNLICILLSGAHRGAIYFWDHELELERSGYNNLAILARSFSEFLSILHDEEV